MANSLAYANVLQESPTLTPSSSTCDEAFRAVPGL